MPRKYLDNENEGGASLVCAKHRAAFVHFGGAGKRGSWGCPVCVAAIRADVHREMANHRKWGRHGHHERAAE